MIRTLLTLDIEATAAKRLLAVPDDVDCAVRGMGRCDEGGDEGE